ncbi:MAG: hypothetical protein KAU21_18830 [Gammaproteobacteria bacterium]|nr:hypothetical protein [Gammaproteobacteria bacterium]
MFNGCVHVCSSGVFVLQYNRTPDIMVDLLSVNGYCPVSANCAVDRDFGRTEIDVQAMVGEQFDDISSNDEYER